MTGKVNEKWKWVVASSKARHGYYLRSLTYPIPQLKPPNAGSLP